jgi:hypothetical protein
VFSDDTAATEIYNEENPAFPARRPADLSTDERRAFSDRMLEQDRFQASQSAGERLQQLANDASPLEFGRRIRSAVGGDAETTTTDVFGRLQRTGETVETVTQQTLPRIRRSLDETRRGISDVFTEGYVEVESGQRDFADLSAEERAELSTEERRAFSERMLEQDRFQAGGGASDRFQQLVDDTPSVNAGDRVRGALGRQVRVDIGLPSRQTVFAPEFEGDARPVDIPPGALEAESESELPYEPGEGEFGTEGEISSNRVQATQETRGGSGVVVQRVIETEPERETESDDPVISAYEFFTPGGAGEDQFISQPSDAAGALDADVGTGAGSEAAQPDTPSAGSDLLEFDTQQLQGRQRADQQVLQEPQVDQQTDQRTTQQITREETTDSIADEGLKTVFAADALSQAQRQSVTSTVDQMTTDATARRVDQSVEPTTREGVWQSDLEQERELESELEFEREMEMEIEQEMETETETEFETEAGFESELWFESEFETEQEGFEFPEEERQDRGDPSFFETAQDTVFDTGIASAEDILSDWD